MDKKTTDIVLDGFEKLDISREDFPSYENPSQFAETFQECSIQEYMNVSYSNTTLELTHSKKDKK